LPPPTVLGGHMREIYTSQRDTWMKKGKCKNLNIPTPLFFDDFQKVGKDERQKILGICNSCGVEVNCRQYAVRHKLDGVWGGIYFERGREPKAGTLKVAFKEDMRDASAFQKRFAQEALALGGEAC